MPVSFTLGLIVLWADSTVMPTISTFLPLNSSAILLNLGISAMQGSHQAAQKSTIRTLPFRSAAFNLPPATFSSSKSGAGPLTATVPESGPAFVEAGEVAHQNDDSASKTTNDALFIVSNYK